MAVYLPNGPQEEPRMEVNDTLTWYQMYCVYIRWPMLVVVVLVVVR